mgnify:CR=1 FL=1
MNMKFETPNGKEIEIYRCPTSAQFRVKFTSGGELPEQLSGLYTDSLIAQTDVLRYIEEKETKKKPKMTIKEKRKAKNEKKHPSGVGSM